MAQLLFLIGVPGSGKTTYTQKYQELGYKVHSSDAIREELSRKAKIRELKENNIDFKEEDIKGDPNAQEFSRKAFMIMFNRTVRDLNKGNNVIYDACNTNRRSRKQTINQIKEECPDIKIIGVVFDIDIDTCKLRNEQRTKNGSKVLDKDGNEYTVYREVPEEVIDRMYKALHDNFPNIEEGFDSLEIIEIKNIEKNIEK